MNIPTENDAVRRLEALEREVATARRRRRALWSAGLGALALWGALGSAAPSTPVPCSSSDLYCLMANHPAVAADVNSNFETVRALATRASVSAGVLTFAGQGVTVARAALADSATAATNAATATNALAINNAKLFVKHGNNGTASCRSFCGNVGGTWDGGVGACVGIDCDGVPGFSGNGYSCLCLTP